MYTSHRLRTPSLCPVVFRITSRVKKRPMQNVGRRIALTHNFHTQHIHTGRCNYTACCRGRQTCNGARICFCVLGTRTRVTHNLLACLQECCCPCALYIAVRVVWLLLFLAPRGSSRSPSFLSFRFFFSFLDFLLPASVRRHPSGPLLPLSPSPREFAKPQASGRKLRPCRTRWGLFAAHIAKVEALATFL